jgi:hypothetical protein
VDSGILFRITNPAFSSQLPVQPLLVAARKGRQIATEIRHFIENIQMAGVQHPSHHRVQRLAVVGGEKRRIPPIAHRRPA